MSLNSSEHVGPEAATRISSWVPLVLTLALCAPGQEISFEVGGLPPNAPALFRLRATGDFDGATSPAALLLPRAPGLDPLLVGPAFGVLTLTGIADADFLDDATADGRREVAVALAGSLISIDAATGVPLWVVAHPGGVLRAVPDLNGDSSTDLVVLGAAIAAFDGRTGLPIPLVPLPPGSEPLGDLNRDGVLDWATPNGQVLDGATAAVAFQSPPGYRVVAIPGDLDGDGVLEVLSTREVVGATPRFQWRVQGWMSPLPLFSTGSDGPVTGVVPLGDVFGTGREAWLLGTGARSGVPATLRFVRGPFDSVWTRPSAGGASGIGGLLADAGALDGDAIPDSVVFDSAGSSLLFLATRPTVASVQPVDANPVAALTLQLDLPGGGPPVLGLPCRWTIVGPPTPNTLAYLCTAPALATPIQVAGYPVWIDPAGVDLLGIVGGVSPWTFSVPLGSQAPLLPNPLRVQALVGPYQAGAVVITSAVDVTLGHWMP